MEETLQDIAQQYARAQRDTHRLDRLHNRTDDVR